ncbi:hypothetical protein [Paenibacillus sp.]|uniref:hypothetical protein n=1 Tax=Paenibacillus sp. TaxID=58172 RepID=UPI002D353BD0|nr:hypothetical protein [Paenibacillus sp.]HZG56246.1 hypothetical protein [Paenibacillus sp.]
MAACDPWKYTSVTPEVFRTLRSMAQKEGFHIPNAPSGEFSIRKAGVTVQFHFTWNQTTGALKLTCLKKPQLIGCPMVKSIADQIVRQSGGRPA